MDFKIIDRVIECTNENLIGDNADYTANFTFDDEWIGKVVTARFIRGNEHVDRLLENNKCLIPVEVLKSGYIKVGVFTDEMTSTYCSKFVYESIKEQNGNTIEPTPDIYAQIIARLNDMQSGNISDDMIESAVNKYLEDHPINNLTNEDVQNIVSKYVTEHEEDFKGEPGYTPQKCVDYWTAEDISEIQSYIDTQIGGVLSGSY